MPGDDVLMMEALSDMGSAVFLCHAGDTVLMMEALSDMGSAVSATAIKSRDAVLSRVRRMVLHGWQQQEGVDFQPTYEQRKYELSVEDGCALWGSRVVVPPAGREAVVRLLHEGHPGISRMKALARGVVWWLGLDSQLESKVKECVACQSSRKSPPKAPLHPWEWPTKLGYIACGFCGAIVR